LIDVVPQKMQLFFAGFYENYHSYVYTLLALFFLSFFPASRENALFSLFFFLLLENTMSEHYVKVSKFFGYQL